MQISRQNEANFAFQMIFKQAVALGNVKPQLCLVCRVSNYYCDLNVWYWVSYRLISIGSTVERKNYLR